MEIYIHLRIKLMVFILYIILENWQKKLGIQEKRALSFITTLLKGISQAKDLIAHSFLEDALKEHYCKLLEDRSRALENYSFMV